MQPLYYRFWGGMPSARMLAAANSGHADRSRIAVALQRLFVGGASARLSQERRIRIVDALADYFKAPSATDEDLDGLFIDAMSLCNKERLGRVDNFNASYAFHRALLTAGLFSTVALAVSLAVAAAQRSPFRTGALYVCILTLFLTLVEFRRAKQRGEYFVAEVLNMSYVFVAERDSGPTPVATT
jgi:hypothetical protein